MFLKIISLGIILFFTFSFPDEMFAGVREELSPAAGAVLLMDAQNGQILYEKNMRQQMFPASTTKILTAIIALEEGMT